MFSLLKAFRNFKPFSMVFKNTFQITRTENFDLELKCFNWVMEKSVIKNPASILHEFNQYDNTLSQLGDEWVFSTNAETAQIYLKLFKKNKTKKNA